MGAAPPWSSISNAVILFVSFLSCGCHCHCPYPRRTFELIRERADTFRLALLLLLLLQKGEVIRTDALPVSAQPSLGQTLFIYTA